MAAIRAAIDIPIDVYVEAPADVGGFILNVLERAGSEAITSDPGAAGLAVPVVASPQGRPRVVTS